MENKQINKSSWAIGGMAMVGVGAGLFLLQTNPINLVVSIISGIG